MTTTPHHAGSLSLYALQQRSLEVITSLQAANGAYPASPTFSAYQGYCWFRDGAFIADGVSAAGEQSSASRFFDWCAGVVERHQDSILAAVAAADAGTLLPPAKMLPARFTMDGDLGTDDWWDFQLDGYGTWLWAVTQHAERHGLPLDRWRPAAQLTVDYLTRSWDRPCFDWWEEHDEHVHVSTLGCVAAGLRAAVTSGLIDGRRRTAAERAVEQIDALIEKKGVVDGHLVKWLGTDAVDGSLAALVAPLGVIDPTSDVATRTVEELTSQLSAQGGVYRFRADTFYGGGRWPLLTCFLGLAHAARGDLEAADRCLRWAAATATAEGHLPEQVDGLLLAPDRRAEWLDRWGTVATPLLWSHAMVLRLAAELHHDDPAEVNA